ncbi:MAG: type II secretion system protein N [Pseudomonadota bacterium]
MEAILNRLSFRAEGAARALWLRTVLNLVLLALLALAAARLIWLFVDPRGSVSQVTEPAAGAFAGAAASPSIQADISRLIELNPFSVADAPASPVEDVVYEEPETTLNLVLDGQRAATGDATGAAWITTPDNTQEMFFVGDEILPGVTLERILSDRVILGRNGARESLFSRGEAGGLTVIGRDGEDAREGVGEAVETTERAVARVSLDALLADVRLAPAERDGAPFGQRVRIVGDGAGAAAAGLKEGDVVIAVDGIAVSEADQSRLAALLSRSGGVALELERDGSRVELSLEFTGETVR